MRFATAVLVMLVAWPAAADPSYTIFDLPNSIATRPKAVNAAGTVAGYYYGKKHSKCSSDCGFIRHADGTFTTFSIANATIDVAGIDDQDTVAGTYEDDTSLYGFLRTADGTITKINLPGGQTRVSAMNANGAVAGTFVPKDFTKGFLRAPDGSKTTFKSTKENDTIPQSINADGAITGYIPAQNKTRAFIRAADGKLTVFNAPHAGRIGTDATAIDDAGDVAGQFLDRSSLWHGFLRDADGTMHVFEVPGVEMFGTIQVACIANVGADRQVLGLAEGAALHAFGFIHHEDGTVETFDLSQGGVEYVGTFVLGCSRTGLMTGFYADDLDSSHGFLRTP